MKKLSFIFLLGLAGTMVLSAKKESDIRKDKFASLHVHRPKKVHLTAGEKLYQELQLEGIVQYPAFNEAFQGFNSLNADNKDVLTIIDFTLPSTEKRLTVIDMKNKKVLFHSLVSHGRNSGENFATSFSNANNSHQSSLGFYKTENTYQGGNGYSLVLEGLEANINDQAKARAIVMHGADYCSENIIKALGRLGRSYGCPAIPRELTKPIINTIKGGSLLYIYANNPDYLARTTVINHQSRNLLAAHFNNEDQTDKTGDLN